ncbi:MAG: hypothetical protein COW00_07440 [Bdellovibrio sp. CG12_big_fil_rev_8_21_14_0_65_39_13]|nr:MAG: hypothetical protein COW78_08275 [Bdellovibrio sp. CG22_combo_CG10-13_8_21_14_all_39_27]PIQ60203.1 MAG: hypothetical protein COW00_07440 [Bdellovibrio sp. CG12_big_fil_rev_8_21_14_0_65_39_13]PIR36736.1 MAG: hypothetical protein COV37_01945 [Bdellovibrio sp. CG11_big_fil_rev_8_21_14_0_20_39_38]PJB53084.1 MAG: hypothetical protein CO099_09125 [Bdellovibrio sp. CG_4_9_14_3_um_filter_39_7]
MINNGKLHTFLDLKKNFTLSYFHAGDILDLLYNLHQMPADGQKYFEDSILTSVQLINFLKPQEMMGFYIDSIDPKFMLKIEMNESGSLRTLLLPENFSEFPTKITGECRLTKMIGSSSVPYTSIIKLENISFSEIINQTLRESYQVEAKISVFQHKPISVMIHRLPRTDMASIDQEIEDKMISTVIDFYNTHAFSDEKEMIAAVEKLGFIYLRTREIEFRCNCSRERMVSGLVHLSQGTSIDGLFEDKSELETRCDYCKTSYLITKDEVIKASKFN